MKPSIGRIVHYVEHCGTHKPAMVAAVHHGDVVDLTVFGFQNEPACRARLNVLPDVHNAPLTWHWPERES